MKPSTLVPAALDLDVQAEAERIAAWLREGVGSRLRKRGAVVALSGGVDSSVCAALAVRALGPHRVFGLLLPERESSAASAEQAEQLCAHLGIARERVEITATLQALGCYDQRDAAVRRLWPDYGPGWRCRLRIDGGLQSGINFFRLDVQAPDGTRQSRRLPHRDYLQIVAATNYKQRVRKTVEYFHADRLNFAVIGTPNRLEFDLGFFVKQGDGMADLKPIAHLYKTQVTAMARGLGLPQSICTATPTTDTYSLAQGQDEFFFALPLAQMDLALWAHRHGHGPQALAAALGIDEAHAQRVLSDIEAKRRTTAALHGDGETLG